MIPPCVSVVRIGPDASGDEGNLPACILRKALLDHFKNESDHRDNDSDQGNQEISITNKYFTAAVALRDIIGRPSNSSSNDNAKNVDQAVDSTGDTKKEDGIILVFDARKNNAPNPRAIDFDSLGRIHSWVENAGGGDLLRLCVGVTNVGQEQLNDSKGDRDPEAEKEYSRRILWCLDRGYEYVEADLSSAGLLRGHAERDKEGFARIVEAIRGTVWSSAVMATAKKNELKSSYAEAKAHAHEQPSLGVANLPAYEPPNPSLLGKIPDVGPSNPDDGERESRARQAILEQSGVNDDQLLDEMSGMEQENLDPVNIPDSNSSEEDRRRRSEELEQERVFNDFEGALRQARSIREMSRSGTLSDDERRNRAGEAAVLLMDLMGKMGFGESDEEGSEEEMEQQQAA